MLEDNRGCNGNATYAILETSMKSIRVVLVDGANLAYRSQFTHGQLSTSTGKKSGVIYSFLRMLHRLYKKFGYSPIIVFWEGGHLEVLRSGKTYEVTPSVPTWRKELKQKTGNTYKAKRQITQDVIDCHAQIPHIQKALDILRHPQLSVPGLEGDDLIGIAAARLSRQPYVEEVAIVSSDRDYLQCVKDNVFLYRPGRGLDAGGLIKYDSKKVKAEFGIPPSRFAEYKALIGDGTDGYKGVPNVGPVKAVEIIKLGGKPNLSWNLQTIDLKEKYPDLEKVWQHARDCYKLALIPSSEEHPFFTEELTLAAIQAFRKFEKHLFRNFTLSELKASTQAFTEFCSRWELNAILAEKRKYFEGAVVDGDTI